MKLIATTLSTVALLSLASTVSSQPEPDCWGRADGVDFPGNDLTSERQILNLCARDCYYLANCKAWTWSDHEGGTCWFKSGYGNAVINPATNSGVRRSCTAARNSLYAIVDNCDIRGYDADNRPGKSYHDCIGVSDKSFTWSDYNGGTCWFKTAVVPCEYAPNKFSGVHMY